MDSRYDDEDWLLVFYRPFPTQCGPPVGRCFSCRGQGEPGSRGVLSQCLSKTRFDILESADIVNCDRPLPNDGVDLVSHVLICRRVLHDEAKEEPQHAGCCFVACGDLVSAE